SVRARGPFIRRGLQVDGGPDEVIVTTSDGERRRLDDPEQDLSDIVDWWLPVESLRSWLLGLPDPRYPADPQTGGAEVLTSLEQRLWTLDYESYQLAAGLLVPRRIGMRHEALEIRVTVLGWTPETVETVGSGASLGAGAGGFE